MTIAYFPTKKTGTLIDFEENEQYWLENADTDDSEPHSTVMTITRKITTTEVFDLELTEPNIVAGGDVLIVSPSVELPDFPQLSVRTLRLGSSAGALGLTLGIILMALNIQIGIAVLFFTLGIVGLFVYAFWMETSIEILNPRVLVAGIIATFGLGIMSLLALLL